MAPSQQLNAVRHHGWNEVWESTLGHALHKNGSRISNRAKRLSQISDPIEAYCIGTLFTCQSDFSFANKVTFSRTISDAKVVMTSVDH
jgi:hypothetical protein